MIPIMPVPLRDFFIAIAAMIVVVVASNILVQYPVAVPGLDHILTWGAFPYPFAFIVSDLTTRRFGAFYARRVAYIGFVVAVFISIIVASPRIAFASGLAFLSSQLLDIYVFSHMRQKVWWLPPFTSSLLAAALDTFIFFSIAFYCGSLPLLSIGISGLLALVGIQDTCPSLPWQTLALGDYAVKIMMGLFALGPYRILLEVFVPDAVKRG